MDMCFITIAGLRKYDEAQKGETRAFPEVIASARAACRRLVVRQWIWATSGEVREMAVDTRLAITSDQRLRCLCSSSVILM